MFATALGVSVALTGANQVGALLADHVTAADEIAAWAGPANTLLLIVLFVITSNRHQTVKSATERTQADVQQVQSSVESVQSDVSHAASAAASAAAAAETAARVAKDVGGAYRATQVPPVPNGESKS